MTATTQRKPKKDLIANVPAQPAVAEVEVEEEARFDPSPGRMHDCWRGYSNPRVVAMKHSRPVDKNGKELLGEHAQMFILQDGNVYDADGVLVPWEKVPQVPKEIFQTRIKTKPFPGITHACRIWRCPVDPCNFSTPVKAFYLKHTLNGHGLTQERLADLEAAARGETVPTEQRDRFDVGDFLRPSEVSWYYGEEPVAPEAALDLE